MKTTKPLHYIAILFALQFVSNTPADPPPRNVAVEVTAALTTSPTGVRLTWTAPIVDEVENPTYVYTVARKNKGATAWGSHTQRTSGWVDTTATSGEYEYEIIRRLTDINGAIQAFGYVAVSIGKGVIHDRGKIVLLVDNTLAAPLAGDLARLKADLMGDGWTVIRHDVARGLRAWDLDVRDAGSAAYNSANYKQQVIDTRDKVKQAYGNGSQNVKSVFIIGHVPVPYSGFMAPDYHFEDHEGAWVADAYYGDMDDWTDTLNYAAAGSQSFPNLANDGRWDASISDSVKIPGDLELEVGRVDFSWLTDFANKTPSRSELDLTRAYLRRNHDFKHGILVAERKGYIMDCWGWINGDSPAAAAWRAFSGFFGSANIVDNTGQGNYIGGLVGSTRYLWSWGGGGGTFTSMGCLYVPQVGEPGYGVYAGNSADWFALKHPKTIFSMFLGSYFGDWDRESNLLRSALASGDCLSVVWSGRPQHFVHGMRIGDTVGSATKLSANNKFVTGTTPHYRFYRPAQESFHEINGIHGTHVSLLGDPTLRQDIIKPVKNLGMTINPTTVTVSWSASGESYPSGSFYGYLVYKATGSAGVLGSFSYLGVTSGTSWTDSRPLSGNVIYMVKVAKWEEYNSSWEIGTYLNTSVGVMTPAYTLTSLGRLTQSSAFSYAYGNNSAGKVVGSADANSIEHAILRVGANTTVIDNSSINKTIANAINDSDWVVGWGRYYDGVNPSDWRAWKWKIGDSAITFLPELPSSYVSQAYAINKNGIIVGQSQNGNGAYNRAVIWDGGATDPDDLGSIGGTSSHDSYAYSINSNGRIVGKSKTGNNVYHGFAMTTAPMGTGNDLGTITANDLHSSDARDLNDYDEIVGSSTGTSGQTRAFFKTGTVKNGNFIDLGVLGTGDMSWANSINNFGDVVGDARHQPAQGYERAFIYRKGWTTMQMLQNYQPINNGWSLMNAASINDSGQIVGWGYSEEIPFGVHSHALYTIAASLNCCCETADTLVRSGDAPVSAGRVAFLNSFKDHFSTVASNYAAFRPRYPKELFSYIAAITPAKDLAWDCACGNGQATVDLANHCSRVVGTDASAQQISAADARPNIEYRVAPAESSGLADASADVITVAQALHWFPLDSFYLEARRVLKPAGLLAVWSYGATHIDCDVVDELVQDFHYNRIGPYWPPGREHVEEGYRSLSFPFSEFSTPKFEMLARWNMQQLIGYFSSWSGTKRYTEALGKSPLPQLEAELLTVWGDPSVPRSVRWPLAVRFGRKP